LVASHTRLSSRACSSGLSAASRAPAPEGAVTDRLGIVGSARRGRCVAHVRDYYRHRLTPRAPRFWRFRAGLYTAKAAPKWWLHGRVRYYPATGASCRGAINFSFLPGASHSLGASGGGRRFSGAMTRRYLRPRNSLAGVVRAWSTQRDLMRAALEEDPRAPGCRLGLRRRNSEPPGLPSDREAYGRLTRLLTRRAAPGQEAQWKLALATSSIMPKAQLCLVVAPDSVDEGPSNPLLLMAGRPSRATICWPPRAAMALAPAPALAG